jgi:hypothetical protein
MAVAYASADSLESALRFVNLARDAAAREGRALLVERIEATRRHVETRLAGK